ncbi:MAG: hypothetical protein PWP03_560 [Candidatus Woesearchaeota archaeon]|nr:hypothetical protein [Candidatus Woesearchaeota archaeon]
MTGLVDKIEEYFKIAETNRPKELLSGNSYLKDKLTYWISRYIHAENNFEKKLYNTVPKQELKKCYYGILSINFDKKFTRFVKDLTTLLEKTLEEYKQYTSKNIDFDTDWFKVAFFTGFWEEAREYKSKYNPIKEEPNNITPYDLIKKGYDVMHSLYAKRRAIGKYKRKEVIKIPGSQFFRKTENKYEILTPELAELIDLFSEVREGNKEKINALYHQLSRVNQNAFEIANLLYNEIPKNINETVINQKSKNVINDIYKLPLFNKLAEEEKY